MRVAKGRDSAEHASNEVFTALVLLKSRKFRTDVLISLHSPLLISDSSQVSSAKGTECTDPLKLLVFFKLIVQSLKLLRFSSLFTD